MRTKQSKAQAKASATPKLDFKSQLNGTPKSTTTSKARANSLQPTELSAEYWTLLRDWLNAEDNDHPFEVHTVPLSKKRKRSNNKHLQVQDDLFQERLTVQYKVEPKDKWESLRRYKRFTVGSESIATGECILVKHDDTNNPKIDSHSQWKAKVLEVRALDPEHVYIRLSWLNRPEDLGSGRKDYHGKNELVPTNQMDIIDAMAVNGGLKVKHWDETADDDETSMPAEDEYFWRQTFDFANTKTFSELRKICVDEAPQNPDELIVQCSSASCRKWLHVRCIAEQALQRAIDDQAAPKRSSKAQRKKSKSARKSVSNPKTTPVAEVSKSSTKVEVFFKGHPDGAKGEPATEDEIVITTEDGEQYSENVCCLFCGAEVD